MPTSADNVFFDANSGAVTVTVTTGNARTINCTGFTGALAGSGTLTVYGSVTLSPGMTYTHTGTMTISGSGTIISAGKELCNITVSGAGISVTMGDALTTAASRNLDIVQGSFSTANYALSVNNFFANGSNARSISFGSSTVTVRSSAFQILSGTNLTFDAGTSLLNISTGSLTAPNGTIFYNVSFTGVNSGSSIAGGLVFNNLTKAGRTSGGINALTINANQTINGTLTLSAGTNATMRTFVRSDTIGTSRTLTCAAVASLTDIDFRDITIAGAAAPVSGTRLGDCKGNSGITFGAPKTVYWGSASGGNWGSISDTWALANGGATSYDNFPLAQDTAVFANYPNTGQTITVNAAYNIGTIDMSARTSNTMTLSCAQSPTIYGNWINGTGTTLTGTGVMAFAGRGSQTITSAGKTFTQSFTISAFGGSVTLLDAFVSNRSATSAFLVITGTFDANGYAFTLSGASSRFDCSGGSARTIALGSGAWTIAGSATAWNASNATNLTVTGTGTISLTSASAKTFEGGSIQTYPTINQGGTGTLTISGSNKFAGITNTAIGSVQFQGGTTNEFGAFNLNGVSGNLLQVGSTNTTQAILKKPGAWNVGANSTDAGNNTGLTFSAGTVDYLSVSYINGQVVSTGTITGTLTATEAQDLAALLGNLAHIGDLAAAEAQDSAALIGKLVHAGVLAATEAQDSFYAVGVSIGVAGGLTVLLRRRRR